MTDLSAFPITRKWPPRHPDRLQLYSLPTPNGVKVSILLEETGLPYEPHRVALREPGPDCRRSSCRSIRTTRFRPSSIPTVPGASRSPLFESGAILIYLAEKTGKFIPKMRAAAMKPSSG